MSSYVAKLVIIEMLLIPQQHHHPSSHHSINADASKEYSNVDSIDLDTLGEPVDELDVSQLHNGTSSTDFDEDELITEGNCSTSSTSSTDSSSGMISGIKHSSKRIMVQTADETIFVDEVPILPHHTERLHPLLSLFYFTPVSAFCLIPTFFVIDYAKLTDSALMQNHIGVTAAIILVGALMSFGLNTSELLVLQATSALSLCVFGVCKFLLVIVFTTLLFHHELTTVNKIGCALSVLGVALYNVDKYQEQKRRRKFEAATKDKQFVIEESSSHNPQIPAKVSSPHRHNITTTLPRELDVESGSTLFEDDVILKGSLSGRNKKLSED